eukprot:CAMPEP_0180047882 /NCGR_PEP_ID=MMETSP0984-20121128/38003_1 /TAXON_ID=483367 /ORGANISM="non described non described, Strain CCMP 2436" /LENGTH=233 /DNA_ID=CAMNT_0021976765 /DNA_START=97 /DNA_END=795 /DNA_ORIENTATION=+
MRGNTLNWMRSDHGSNRRRTFRGRARAQRPLKYSCAVGAEERSVALAVGVHNHQPHRTGVVAVEVAARAQRPKGAGDRTKCGPALQVALNPLPHGDAEVERHRVTASPNHNCSVLGVDTCEIAVAHGLGGGVATYPLSVGWSQHLEPLSNRSRYLVGASVFDEVEQLLEAATDLNGRGDVWDGVAHQLAYIAVERVGVHVSVRNSLQPVLGFEKCRRHEASADERLDIVKAAT